jgi:hypothetical protein
VSEFPLNKIETALGELLTVTIQLRQALIALSNGVVVAPETRADITDHVNATLVPVDTVLRLLYPEAMKNTAKPDAPPPSKNNV